jgi:hypothetical protein
MLFEKLKEWNSVISGRDMANEGNKTQCGQGKMSLCSGEEDVKHILLDCKDYKHWRLKLIHDK